MWLSGWMRKESCRLLHQPRGIFTEWSLWTAVEGMWKPGAGEARKREPRVPRPGAAMQNTANGNLCCLMGHFTDGGRLRSIRPALGGSQS